MKRSKFSEQQIASLCARPRKAPASRKCAARPASPCRHTTGPSYNIAVIEVSVQGALYTSLLPDQPIVG